MSEAWGSIVIKATHDFLSDIDLESDELSLESVERLFQYAGIDSPLETLDFTFDLSGFPHEGMGVKQGFLYITTFGDEWMEMIK